MMNSGSSSVVMAFREAVEISALGATMALVRLMSQSSASVESASTSESLGLRVKRACVSLAMIAWISGKVTLLVSRWCH
jgi:hypothetical protein